MDNSLTGGADLETAAASVEQPETEAAPTQDALAWSQDQALDEPVRAPWGVAWRRAAALIVGGFLAAGAVVWGWEQVDQPAPQPTPAPAAATQPPPRWLAGPAPTTQDAAKTAIDQAAQKIIPPTPASAPWPNPAPNSDPDESFYECPSGHSGVLNEATSCDFADSVSTAFHARPSNTVYAYSPVTNTTYKMTCDGPYKAHLTGGTVQTSWKCVGGNNAAVVVW